MAPPHIEIFIAPGPLPDNIPEQRDALSRIAFPDPPPVPAHIFQPATAPWHAATGATAQHLFIIRHEGRLAAMATVYPRHITTPLGRRHAALLAGVASQPEFRGLGFGKALIRTILNQVDAGQYDLAFFQTGTARGFYEKLGCRCNTLPVINSLNPVDPAAHPCWDTYTMVYPASLDWPDGTIDLLGPAV